jgi:hypothetical protein
VVKARIDDQPDRAEQIGLKIADPAERLVGIDTQFVGDPLGIQAPALIIGREAAGPAIERKLALLRWPGSAS